VALNSPNGADVPLRTYSADQPSTGVACSMSPFVNKVWQRRQIPVICATQPTK